MKLGLEQGPDSTAGIIKLAILAVGGQGGGVLTNWITELAQGNGYHVQATSVAGVAQRTGATIYYVEMMPVDPDQPDRQPVFALSPAPGDVDIVVAAELAEAGRAVLRGFVTPDRTALIASSHRVLAVSEKIVPGSGAADASLVSERADEASRRFIHFDMEAMARQSGSVISASLFGALAGSGELPFSREAFEETIRAGGRGVEASLAAFGLAYERAAGQTAEPTQAATESDPAVHVPGRLEREWQTVAARLDRLPAPVREMAEPGLKKVVDYLDVAYGAEYLDRLETAVARDDEEKRYAFSREAAKYIANAMVYDDIVRVADLKTRASRFERVKRDVSFEERHTFTTTEYFHPRMEEVCGAMPARLGAAIQARPKLMRMVNRFVDRGRRIRTDSLHGFLMLWAIAGLRRWRRGLLRHQIETTHLEEWLDLAAKERNQDYELGVEVLKCRRLIKGYSDTHIRSHSKFDKVLGCLPLLRGRNDAAEWLRRLREAALADAEGAMLDGAVDTVRSFTENEERDAV